jgi:hypothetical protein
LKALLKALSEVKPSESAGTDTGTFSARKARQRKYLEENVAAETVQLDPAEMKVLDDALAPGKSRESVTPTGSWRRSIGEADHADSSFRGNGYGRRRRIALPYHVARC